MPSCRFRVLPIDTIKKIICFLLVCAALCAPAQHVKQASNVLQAMTDEIQRGMDKLELKGYRKPFYMFCRLEQRHTYFAAASNGALTGANASSELSLGNFRVLCGSYDFNDESLMHGADGSMNQWMTQIALPEDTADYNGIRRSLWSSMENIFVGAAKGFAKNEESLIQKGTKIEQTPHRSFGKTSPAKVIRTFSPAPIEKEKWEKTIKRWSDSLARIPDVISSGIRFSYASGYTYMYSTEGLTGQLPNSLASAHLSVVCKNADGEEVSLGLVLEDSSPAAVLDENRIAAALRQVREATGHTVRSKNVEDTYRGPVLFLGEAVAQAMLGALADFEEPLAYRDETATDEDGPYGYGMRAKKHATKFGTSVTHKSISIKVDPSRTRFGTTVLTGGYELDEEGTVPVPLTLIEGGALQGLMNNRTLTAADQPVNGYSGSLGGVVEMSVSGGVAETTLAKRLLEEVKTEGLEFGIVVRSLPGGELLQSRLFLDGHEEAVSVGSPVMLSWKALRKLVAASTTSMAYNVDFLNAMGRGGMWMNPRMMNFAPQGARSQGRATSFIVPSGMVVGDLDIEPVPQRRPSRHYVPRPE